MKKIATQISILMLIWFSGSIKAQSCDSIVDFPFYDEMLTSEGFVPSDVITCVQNGQNVELLIPFITLTKLNTTQSQDSIAQISIDNIGNLPCGLCWATNKISRSYNAGEQGCLLIRGITNTTIGQYTLDITLSITLRDGMVVSTTLNNVVGPNQKVILRVLGPDDSITPINYLVSGNTSLPCN